MMKDVINQLMKNNRVLSNYKFDKELYFYFINNKNRVFQAKKYIIQVITH